MLSSVGGHFQSALVGSQLLECGFAAFFRWFTECFPYHLQTFKLTLHTRFTQAVPIRETEPERELLTVSKGNAFGCPEGIPRGRESKLSPLASLCLTPPRFESKCPPRHEGQALRQQKVYGEPVKTKSNFKRDY